MTRVLVTGGAGFIGLHLLRRLCELGFEVIAVDNFKRARRDSFSEASRSGAVRLVEADVRDFDAIRAAVNGCRKVFHLAAQSNVMGAVEDPDYSITTNVLGTFNVLRAAAEEGADRVVFTSSREVYGEPADLPVREDAPLLAKNPYGASKLAGEAYCRTFANTHGLKVEVLRLANVYGPGDSGRVIPLWLTAAQRGEDLNVYGGEQVLDLLWVGTAVDALVHASDRDLPGPVNIGSGVGVRILDLAAKILAVTHSSSRVVRTAARGVEVSRFVASTERMRALGLVPESDSLAHLAEIAPSYASA